MNACCPENCCKVAATQILLARSKSWRVSCHFCQCRHNFCLGDAGKKASQRHNLQLALYLIDESHGFPSELLPKENGRAANGHLRSSLL